MLTPQKGFHGLGPVISGDGDAARFGHDGFNLGFEASMVGFVDGDKGAVVMANSNFSFVLIIEILESIARVYGWPKYVATNMWPPDAPLPQQAVTAVPSDLVAASSGAFKAATGETMTLYKKGASLFVKMPLDGEAEVFVADDGQLFCPPLQFSELGSPWLQLGKDERGVVTKVRAGYQAYAEYRRLD